MAVPCALRLALAPAAQGAMCLFLAARCLPVQVARRPSTVALAPWVAMLYFLVMLCRLPAARVLLALAAVFRC